jgi:hypothetical protein
VGKKDGKQEAPLSSEARKRGEWRGEGASLRQEVVPGHTLPESERAAASDESGGKTKGGLTGAIMPPD